MDCGVDMMDEMSVYGALIEGMIVVLSDIA
jgi:hypothetical protein